MSALWILLSDSPPATPVRPTRVLWCPPSAAGQEPPLPVTVLLPPGGRMAPLCHALYAAESDGREGALIISTSPGLPDALSPDRLPDAVTAFLTGPDEGTLFFPSSAFFCQCARETIRAHNPDAGPVSLEALWHQVCLAEGRTLC